MHFPSILTGVLVGLGVAGTVIYYYTEAWIDSLIEYGALVFVGLLLFLLLSLAAYYGAQAFLRRVTGLDKSPSLDAIVGDALDVISRDPQETVEEQRERRRKLILKSVVWYSNLQYLRFFVSTFVAILVALGGTLGASLLYRQNVLINAQTELLQSQRNLSVINMHQQEGQRRVALYSKLEDGLNAISDASKLSWSHEDEADEKQRAARNAAIKAVAQSASYFKPYWYFDGGDARRDSFNTAAMRPAPLRDFLNDSKTGESESKLSKGSLVFLSPERGMLLYNVAQSAPKIFAYRERIDFSFADVRDKDFEGFVGGGNFECSQPNATMPVLNIAQTSPYADFSGSSFSNINVFIAAFRKVFPVMQEVTLDNTKLEVVMGSDRTTLNLRRAEFANSALVIIDPAEGPKLREGIRIELDLDKLIYGSCILLPDDMFSSEESARDWLANALGISEASLLESLKQDQSDGYHRFTTRWTPPAPPPED